jgi:hypothetical protein
LGILLGSSSPVTSFKYFKKINANFYAKRPFAAPAHSFGNAPCSAGTTAPSAPDAGGEEASGETEGGRETAAMMPVFQIGRVERLVEKDVDVNGEFELCSGNDFPRDTFKLVYGKRFGETLASTLLPIA